MISSICVNFLTINIYKLVWTGLVVGANKSYTKFLEKSVFGDLKKTYTVSFLFNHVWNTVIVHSFFVKNHACMYKSISFVHCFILNDRISIVERIFAYAPPPFTPFFIYLILGFVYNLSCIINLFVLVTLQNFMVALVFTPRYKNSWKHYLMWG